MSEVHVQPVRDRSGLDAFVSFPYEMYRGDRGWAPLLRKDARSMVDAARHPFYQHAERALFLARRDGRVVGRIAALHDRLHLDLHQDGAGFLGFFESVDDQAAAAALFDAAARWLRGRGLSRMRGPMNPSINDEVGVLVEGFEVPAVLMTPHNPPYYEHLYEAAGFTRAKDLLAFQSTSTELPPRLVDATEIARRRYGVTCRPIRMDRFTEEVALVKRLFNEAWQRNWGYVPMTDAEVEWLAGQLEPLVVPELVLFAERGGEPIGMAAAVPDFNVALRANPSGRLFPGILKVLWASRRLHRLRVLLLGVRPEWQGKGIDGLLYRFVWENGRRRGFDWAEAGWVLEDNHAMVNGLRRMGFERYKTWRIYERPL
jgi:GNAT superfamily N-acetyltransferase